MDVWWADVSDSQSEPALPARSGLQVINRTADVLRALQNHRQGMTLAELSAAVALPKSSVHRLVAALQQEGLLAGGTRGRIRLGPLLIQLASASERSLGEDLLATMRRLAADLQETVDVSVLDGDCIRFVAQHPGQRRLQAVSAVGARFPLHCCASGKALLAFLPREEAAALLPARLPALTANTITTRKALWTELDRIRESGVSYDREEHSEGISAVGAVLADEWGAIAGISVPVPTQRFSGREAEFAEHLLTVCRPVLAVLPPP